MQLEVINIPNIESVADDVKILFAGVLAIVLGVVIVSLSVNMM
jgi:hypothetical protein